jgi:Flp pilus assembly pilin Flp
VSDIVQINKPKTLAERGLTTVEYAIGLLAAATAALLLLRIFSDNRFLETLFDWVVGIFKVVSSGQGFGGFLGGLLG